MTTKVPRKGKEAAAAPPVAAQSISDGVGKNNVANAIAEKLRLEIATGHWPTGTLLPPEIDILNHFGVSRPPMREALRMLESEGLLRVTRGHRGGARVMPPDLAPVTRAFGVYVQRRDATLDDLFQSLALCESIAIRELAENRPQAVLIALAQTAAAQGLCLSERSEFHRYEMEFRRTLVNACSNPIVRAMGVLLTEVYDQHMQNITAELPPLDLNLERWDKGVAAKQRLLTHIVQGDADAAEARWKVYLALFNTFTAEFLRDTHIEFYPRGEVRVIAKDEARSGAPADGKSKLKRNTEVKAD